jgi:hypothetical protein
MDTTELLTQQEAATRPLMKPVTLAKRRKRRGGPAFVKFYGKIRYRVTDIEQFIDHGRVDRSQLAQARLRRKRAAR